MSQPQRMCIVCRCRHDKDSMIRMVMSDNSMIVDTTHKHQSRAKYICKSEKCISQLSTCKCPTKRYGFDTTQQLIDQLEVELGK